MFVSIGQAALAIGVAVCALRRWEREERLCASFRTLGGHRRYSLAEIKKTVHSQNSHELRKTAAYARVSSHDQKADLRFGTPLLFKLCGYFGTEVEILNDAKNQTFEEELVGNVIELMTVFSAKIYGKRSHKNVRKAA